MHHITRIWSLLSELSIGYQIWVRQDVAVHESGAGLCALGARQILRSYGQGLSVHPSRPSGSFCRVKSKARGASIQQTCLPRTVLEILRVVVHPEHQSLGPASAKLRAALKVTYAHAFMPMPNAHEARG